MIISSDSLGTKIYEDSLHYYIFSIYNNERHTVDAQ